jgi:hypothetical protein
MLASLTPSQKGAVAEAEIAAAAIRLGLVVLRPLCEGARYDLALDTGSQLLRIQCKWASRRGGVLIARTMTARHTPRGYVYTTYSSAEIDAIGLFSPDTDRCYLVPIAGIEGMRAIHLRLDPPGNGQSAGVRWARDYELERRLPLGRIASAGLDDRRSPR